jgi:hypothetical protein
MSDVEHNNRIRLDENNAIIDHLEAARKLIKQKCARCNGMCMGCLFDGFDRNHIPANLDQAIALMAHLPNERQTVIAEANHRDQERDARWKRLCEKDE